MKPLLAAIERIKGSELHDHEVEEIREALTGLGLDALVLDDLDRELFEMAAAHLEDEEGRVAHVYRDHLGYLTIGVGRLVDERRGGCLSDAEIDQLLHNDVAARASAMRRWPAWRRVQRDPVRATALLSMCFQLGVKGLSRFTTTLGHVATGRFDDAADAMLDSDWAEQTPARAARVAHMMRTGELP